MIAVATAEGVAFISGGATIIAAVILGGLAAWTAERRQTKQLNQAGERQERELQAAAARQHEDLAAERERLAATLASDREQADLQDLRNLLDECAVALNDGRDARDELDVAFTEHGAHIDAEPRVKLEDCGRVIFALLVRLHIRLGKDSAITAHFSDASGALLKTWKAVARFDDVDAGVLIEKRAEVRDARGEFARANIAFTKASVERVGIAPQKPSA